MWFHELNPYRCAVLRKNFPAGTVVEGDIRALSPDDVPSGQAHFFAGIGGFGLACEWAGFDAPIWTGGFPCTDISCAGKGVGLEGRNSGLWFEWLRIIRARRPVRLLIENVPALRTRGYDRIHDALDEIGYSVRSIVVGAEAVGAPHRRNRVWIMAHSGCERREWRADGETGVQPNRTIAGWYQGDGQPQRSGDDAIPDAQRPRRGEGRGMSGDESEAQRRRGELAGGVQLADAAQRGFGTDGSARNAGYADERGAMVLAAESGLEGFGADAREAQESQHRNTGSRWPMPPGPRQHEWEAPRLVESGVGQSANGLSRRVAGFAQRNALQALGDSIVPQVAAEILRTWKIVA